MKLAMLILMLISATNYSFSQALRNDVVIDELMFDPTPQAQGSNGLPEVEFIELRNVSQKTLNLNGWKINDAGTTATINSNVVLLPDSFVVITSVGAAAQLSAFGRSVGVANFPSLDNDGELVYLTSREGKTIFAIEYKSSWHQNAVKSNGGWSLEMIDPKNCCGGASNWISCTNLLGGTPGRKNSVDGANRDITPPRLLRSYATDSLSIVLVFDKSLDSLSASYKTNYQISGSNGIVISATTLAPLFTMVQLTFRDPMIRETVYTITATKLTDCTGNEIGKFNNVLAGLPSVADPLDLVINEILFNPKPEGYDYVEIYNRSKKVIDLKELYLANRSSNGSPASLKQVSIKARLIFPGQYLALTENAAVIPNQFYPKDLDAFLELSSMPSFPDDKGSCLLLSSTGTLVDELNYAEKWHFKLLANNEGVSLERIDYNKSTQAADNWHSASTSSGYGTPGYQNSQFRSELIDDAAIAITPATFSPDNDGHDDFATITYRFPEPGYVCNISIYNINGLVVRSLVQNAVCGLTGFFRWDGLDEKNNKIQVGIYIINCEIYNLKGKTKKFKSGIILARRLH